MVLSNILLNTADSGHNKELKKKIKVLIIAAFPPPVHGAAVMMDTISKLQYDDIIIDRFNINFNKNFQTLEVFQFRKLFLMIYYIVKYLLFRINTYYDIVLLAHSFRFSAFFKDSLFILISKLFNSKIILNARGQKFDINFYNKSNIIEKLFIDYVFSNADAVITVGEKMISEYKKLLKRKYITFVCDYIHNSIDSSHFLSNKLPKDDNNFTVLFLSALTRSKGVFVLLEAVNIIKNKNIDNIKFRLCGNFWNKIQKEKAEVEYFINNNGLKDIVKIVGFVDGENKKREFSSSDIFVFPSLNDSFGIVNLEAMMFGLPIITTRQGAIPEYITEEVNGLFINDNDAPDLAKKIIYLVNNPNLMRNISDNNLIKFKNNFSLAEFKNKWHNIFLKTLNN